MKDLRYTLLPEQYEFNEWAQTRRWFVNSSDMGTGKTLMTLDLIESVDAKRILVVCPKSLISNWKFEIVKFLGEEYLSRFTIKNYERFKEVEDFDFVVFDEAHYLKNSLSGRGSFAIGFCSMIRPKYVALLTGTPMINAADDYYSYFVIMKNRYPVFDAINRRIPQSLYAFREKYCNKRIMKLKMPNGYVKEVVKYYGVRNTDSLKENLSVFMKAVDASKIVGDIPAVTHKIYLNDRDGMLPASTKKEMIANVEKMMEAYNKGDEEAYMTIKKENATIKAAACAMLVKQLGEDGLRTIVFTDHRDSCMKLADILKFPKLVGGQGYDVTQREINQYRDIGGKGLVCTYKVGAEGHNFTESSRMVFSDLPFTYKDLSQAKARIRRKGQTNICVYYYLFANELDEKLHNLIMSKKRDVEAMELCN